MSTRSPELDHQSLTARVGRTLTVAGRSPRGAFLVPLELLRVSDPATTGGCTAFTADLRGPAGTPLTQPGRYLTFDGGQRHTLMISWVEPAQDSIRVRATFVHPVAGEAPARTLAAVSSRSR